MGRGRISERGGRCGIFRDEESHSDIGAWSSKRWEPIKVKAVYDLVRFKFKKKERRKRWREEGRKVGCHSMGAGIREGNNSKSGRVQLGQCQTFPPEIIEAGRRGGISE